MKLVINMFQSFQVFCRIFFPLILTFLLPIYYSFLLIILMVFIDFIFKLLILNKNNEDYDSHKAFRFISKTIIYSLLLILIQSISTYLHLTPFLTQLGDDFFIKIFTLLVLSSELRSIDGKVKELLGFSGLNWLIKIIQNVLSKLIK